MGSEVPVDHAGVRKPSLKSSLRRAFSSSTSARELDASKYNTVQRDQEHVVVPTVSSLEDDQVKNVVKMGLGLAGMGTFGSSVASDRGPSNSAVAAYNSSSSSSSSSAASASTSSILKIPNEYSAEELKLRKVRHSAAVGSSAASDTVTRPHGEQRKVSGSSVTSGGAKLSRKEVAQWYATRIMAGKASVKQYSQLAALLHRGSYEFVKEFIAAKGYLALGVQLQRQNRRSIKTNDQLDIESAVATALKELMNYKEGADSMSHSTSIQHCVLSLVSPRISTRKTVSELLMLLTYWGSGRAQVLAGFEILAGRYGENMFATWFRVLDQCFDSIVPGKLEALKDYALASLFLVNSLIETADLQERVNLRIRFDKCGIQSVLHKTRKLDDVLVLEQADKYEEFKTEDSAEVHQLHESSVLLSDLSKSVNDYKDDPEAMSYICSIFASCQYILTNRDVQTTAKLEKVSQVLFQAAFSHSPDLFDSLHSPASSKVIQTLSVENDELRSSIQHMLDDEDSKSERLRREFKITLEKLYKAETKNSLLAVKNEDLTKDVQALKEGRPLTSAMSTTAQYISPDTPEVQMWMDEPRRASQVASEGVESLIIRHGIQNIRNKSSEIKKIQSPLFGISSPGGYFTDEARLLSSGSPNSTAGSGSVNYAGFRQNDTKIDLNRHSGIYELEQMGMPTVRSSTAAANANASLLPPLLTGSSAPASYAQSGAPPPPPPPPLPQMLKGGVAQKAPDVAVLPPPPPPPPLPPLLLKKAATFSGAPPPPPPPLPALLTAKGPAPVPPPPPPMPALLVQPTRKPADVDPPARGGDDVAERPAADAEPAVPVNESIIDKLPKPKRKLKQIHWDKIENHQLDNTFWTELDKSDGIGEGIVKLGILDEVEEFFAVKTSTMKSRPKQSVDREQGKKSLLPRDLAQHFGINLHPLSGFDTAELILRVLHCDPVVTDNVQILEFFNKDDLSDFSVNLVKQFQPYATDYTKDPVKAPQADPSALERHDRIFLELCFNLRNYWKSRSRALLLIKTYVGNFHDLSRKIDVVDEAILQIKSSESFKNVMNMIRLMGNFMNDDSKKAVGFRLSILQRLKFMKDETNTMTFLQYLEKTIRSSFPELGEFVDELNGVTTASKISIDNLISECDEYQRQIRNCVMSLEQGNLSDYTKFHPDDQILQVLASPIENAKLKGDTLKKKMQNTVTELNNLMEYLGESATGDKNATFAILAQFVEEFKKSYSENIQKEEQKAYESKKRAQAEQAEQRKRDKENVAVHAVQKSEKDEEARNSVMESLLEKLKNSEVVSEQAQKRKANRASALAAYYQVQQSKDAGLDDSDDDDVEQRAQRMLKELQNLQ